MADLNLCPCLCETENRGWSKGRGRLWTRTLHTRRLCACVCVCGLRSAVVCLRHQLWNATALISRTRSCPLGRASPSVWTLKQFLLSCDRRRDSAISVDLCAKHLNCAFDARRRLPSNLQTDNGGCRPCQPARKHQRAFLKHNMRRWVLEYKVEICNKDWGLDFMNLIVVRKLFLQRGTWLWI